MIVDDEFQPMDAWWQVEHEGKVLCAGQGRKWDMSDIEGVCKSRR